MLDNFEFIQKHLGKLGLRRHREEEIVRELSDHLADHAAALEASGIDKNTAARKALDSVSNWPQLRIEIFAAETEVTTMNYRTKVLWLPALIALALSNGLLAIIQILGPLTHIYWLNPYMRLRPFYMFLVPWLILQPVVGAVATYWSRRAGGARVHQLLAALAPATALLGVFVLVLPFSIALDRHVANHIRLSAFLLMTVLWVLLPALPLLLGAAPFLRKPKGFQSSGVSCQ